MPMSNHGTSTRIILMLLASGGKNRHQLMQETNLCSHSVSMTLHNLKTRGQIKKEGKKYYLTGN